MDGPTMHIHRHMTQDLRRYLRLQIPTSQVMTSQEQAMPHAPHLANPSNLACSLLKDEDLFTHILE